MIYLTNPFYRYNKKSFQMSKYKNKQLLCRQFLYILRHGFHICRMQTFIRYLQLHLCLIFIWI